MYRRVTTSVIGLAFLFAGLAGAGCTKKADCKAFAEKVKKCRKEFTKAAIDQTFKDKKGKLANLSDEQLKQARQHVEKQAEALGQVLVAKLGSDEFVKKCKEKSTSKDAEIIKKCLGKKSCEEFSRCIISAVSKH